MPKFQLNKSNLLILLIGTLSIISIVRVATDNNYLSMVISATGIAAVILFFLKQKIFRQLIWLWIAAQAVIITHTVSNMGLSTTQAILDMSQVFSLKLGLSMSGDTNSYAINFNAVVILYFFLFRALKLDALTGSQYVIEVLKGNHDISCSEPLLVTVQQRITLDGDDNWMLGTLNAPLYYNQTCIDRVLIHTEQGLMTSVFRLVPADKIFIQDNDGLHLFERAEWMRFG